MPGPTGYLGGRTMTYIFFGVLMLSVAIAAVSMLEDY